MDEVENNNSKSIYGDDAFRIQVAEANNAWKDEVKL